MNEQKITEIAKNTVHIIEDNKYEERDDYFLALTALGYQFYLIDRDGNEQHYGEAFKSYELPREQIQRVLDGEEYHRSEEHTSELQSRFDLVCRLLLEKKKNTS